MPAPNRYSLYSLKGSIFASAAIGLAWHGIEGLSIGLVRPLDRGSLQGLHRT